MEIKYEIIKTDKIINGKNVTVYGIAAFDLNGVMIENVSDISSDPFSVASLCRLCNIHSLSPVHLREIAEDFVCLDI